MSEGSNDGGGAPRRGWRVALAPLSHRNFALVWWAGLVSNVGTWMETVAVGDLVARTTGQAGWTAVVAAAAFLPMGLLGPVGGALADRLDRRKMLLAMNAAQMACAGALALLAATHHTTPGIVAVTVFVAGCTAGIGFPAYMAMLPDLVPKDELLAGMSLSQAQYNLGRVVGPVLAGLAIRFGSYQAAFGINTLSFAAMLLALTALDLPPRDAPTDDDPLLTRIKVGAQAAWGTPAVRSAIVLVSAMALTASPFIALIPAMAAVRYGGDPSTTARFITAQGIGAVIGALALPVLAERLGRYRMLLLSFLLLPAALVLYGVSPNATVATVALLLVGGTYMFVLSGLGTVVQLRAPAELRARVLSFHFLALGTLYPLGALVQGKIADHVGLGEVTAISGLTFLAVVFAIRAARPERLSAMADPAPAAVPTPA